MHCFRANMCIVYIIGTFNVQELYFELGMLQRNRINNQLF